jgi:hypothetical protein
MRTLSARILLGFAVLAIAFGAMTVNVVVNLTVVEESIHTLQVGHLPLALAANGLARREEDLKSYLDDGLPQETTAYGANVRFHTARSPRDSAFKAVIRATDSYKDLGIPLPGSSSGGSRARTTSSPRRCTRVIRSTPNR